MELDKLFTELRKNLYKSFVFYIPSRLIPKLEDNKVLNTVVFIDSKGFDSELLDDESSHYQILSKAMILNDNIFKLIDQSERLPKHQFDFFLEKYLEHVNFVLYVSNWMGNNVEVDISEIREGTKKAFKLQIQVILKHVEDLKSHIILPNKTLEKQEVNVLEFIENDLTDIKSTLKINSVKPNDTVEKNTTKTSIKIKKKSPLITEEDAEIFLLETVFHIRKDGIK